MIPTIEEICRGLFAGDFTVEQAIEWLYQHMELTDARVKAARQFAAAWLPIVAGRAGPLGLGGNSFDLNQDANELGLAMADDLIRRLRENQA